MTKESSAICRRVSAILISRKRSVDTAQIFFAINIGNWSGMSLHGHSPLIFVVIATATFIQRPSHHGPSLCARLHVFRVSLIAGVSVVIDPMRLRRLAMLFLHYSRGL